MTAPVQRRIDALDVDLPKLMADLHANGVARPSRTELQTEVERLTAELAKYVGHEPTIAEEMKYLSDENARLTARVAELERPEIERKRNEVRESYQLCAAQAEEDRDFESRDHVLMQREAREAAWRAEDAKAGA